NRRPQFRLRKSRRVDRAVGRGNTAASGQLDLGGTLHELLADTDAHLVGAVGDHTLYLREVAELTGQIRDLGSRICPDRWVADLTGFPARFRSVVLGIGRGQPILLSQGVAGFMSKAPCQSV